MNSFLYAMCVGVFASAFVACAPDGSSATSSDGGGSAVSATSSEASGEVPKFGRSLAIDSFQATRRAALVDPAEIAAVDAQTASASMVDISPEAEKARVSYVLDWTVDGYEQALAHVADISFKSGIMPRTQAEAEAASASFEWEASKKFSSLSERPWDSDWTDFARAFMDAQVAPPRPAEWDHIVYTSRRGALSCMKVIAAQGGASTMQEVEASLRGIRALVSKSEDVAFRDLEEMTGK